MAALTNDTKLTTPLERELAFLLADVCDQNLHEEDGVYETGLIRIHKEALMMLVRVGIMEECYPDSDHSESPFRHYYARFKPEVGRAGEFTRVAYRQGLIDIGNGERVDESTRQR